MRSDVDAMSQDTLHCPACEQRIDVNRPMRAALLRSGCVVCGAGLAPEHFV